MFAGRCTYGFYKLMNMTELIASTREEYVELALKMGNNATFNKCVKSWGYFVYLGSGK
jgi:predicted O-linked N-acetylglucosamine transferase (SPINDLY family)